MVKEHTIFAHDGTDYNDDNDDDDRVKKNVMIMIMIFW